MKLSNNRLVLPKFKIITNYVLCMFFSVASPSMAEIENKDIQIRIHSEFADLYDGEFDSWLVRIENRGGTSIPVPLGLSHPDSHDYFPPDQFHLQTFEQAENGITPAASMWQEIMKFGTGELTSGGGGPALPPSMLEPGMAMESQSIHRSSNLRTPNNDRVFRIAMQIGPDEFTYSNWIVRERMGIAPLGMKTILISEPRGEGSFLEFLVSEETDPKYLWSRTNSPNVILQRICELRDDELPEIRLERDRGQFVISFTNGERERLYYGFRVGVTKKTPFPTAYTGKDFSLTPYPISTPSPIGFPSELFNQNVEQAVLDSDHVKSSTFITESNETYDSTNGWWKSKGMIIYFMLAGAMMLFLLLFRVYKLANVDIERNDK